MLLDEKHQSIAVENDTNIYTLGRLGEHNVVISCLPAGQIGTSSAATVAIQMKLAFTKIRFGLLVGIGGGVPSQNADVRLGDVVVSQPQRGRPGVLQYDFGKITPDGFEQTGCLSLPPPILLSAVSALQSTQSKEADEFSHYFPENLDVQEFAREAAGPDVLFEASYQHRSGDTCASCDQERLITREPRAGPDVMVHYGTIASGNYVMKDGLERDRINTKLGGVLCFEMEASGLMNTFPCLVIRGICDYADSHKNKKWHSYAAQTAAMYAKRVLSIVPAIPGNTTPGNKDLPETRIYSTCHGEAETQSMPQAAQKQEIRQLSHDLRSQGNLVREYPRRLISLSYCR